jgi:hypothetical protein
MTPTIWQERLVANITQAFDQCWGGIRPPDAAAGHFTFVDTEEERLAEEMQFVALADLILPFTAAGLLEERDPVGGLPSPAAIRRYVDEHGLADRYMSFGCQTVRPEWTYDPSFGEELKREWSTWLTYCMHAHSPELRGALPLLPAARDAMGDLLIAPRRRVERLGPDGERLVSVVPRRAEDALEAERVEPLLDQCEIVAAHADSFRILGTLFPEIVASWWSIYPYRSGDYPLTFPFIAYLWPFSTDDFRAVVEICDGITRLGQSLYVDEEEERERQPARLR